MYVYVYVYIYMCMYVHTKELFQGEAFTGAPLNSPRGPPASLVGDADARKHRDLRLASQLDMVRRGAQRL